ncbi:MAG: NAD(P)H-dependent oxidoreductase [Alteromonadaceae bacterium]|nr:NAD(P)H-dependent oxidoreductase [Alteromonadaceae bacterium]
MKILHIDCSPRKASQSRKLSIAMMDRLLSKYPNARILRRDLGQYPIPHLDADYAVALCSSQSSITSPEKTFSLSEQLIHELEDADIIVLGTPVNNFTVPSVLKAWFDQILRMGRTIGVTDSGEKVGLLKDLPVYIGIASGGIFLGKDAKQPDFMTSYMKVAFNCMGIRNVHFLPLQGTAFLDSVELDMQREQLVLSMDVEAATCK